jgi:predicted Zn-dependent protease
MKGVFLMNKKEIENVINYALAKRIEYAELFFEGVNSFSMNISKDKIESCGFSNREGVGVRLYKDGIIAYSSTSLVTEENLKNIIDKISHVYKQEACDRKIKLKTIKNAPKKKDIIYLEDYPKEKIREFLISTNEKAKKLDKNIINVTVSFSNSKKYRMIANSDGDYTHEETVRTSIRSQFILEKNGARINGGNIENLIGGLEIFDKFNVDKFLKVGYNKCRNKRSISCSKIRCNLSWFFHQANS